MTNTGMNSRSTRFTHAIAPSRFGSTLAASTAATIKGIPIV